MFGVHKLNMDTPTRSRCFGTCLLEIRRQRAMSQKELALLANMDQSYVSGLEAGRRALPREKQLVRLIQALRATPEEEQDLRVAHAFSRLVDVVSELNPGQGNALVALAHHLQGLNDDIQDHRSHRIEA